MELYEIKDTLQGRYLTQGAYTVPDSRQMWESMMKVGNVQEVDGKVMVRGAGMHQFVLFTREEAEKLATEYWADQFVAPGKFYLRYMIWTAEDLRM